MKLFVSRHTLFDLLFFTALFAVCLALAFHLNFQRREAARRRVFASDKSIYYVYLPANIYLWVGCQEISDKCDTIYKGFILDYKTGKVINKMTCGVALLWSPFFVATHAIAKIFHLHPDGFSDLYQEMALIPPVFFLVLGLFFVKRFLEYYLRAALFTFASSSCWPGQTFIITALLRG